MSFSPPTLEQANDSAVQNMVFTTIALRCVHLHDPAARGVVHYENVALQYLDKDDAG